MKNKLLFSIVTFTFAAVFFGLFSSCEPETIIETEYITVNDTLVVVNTDTIIISTTDTIFIEEEASSTNFILVRHAETTGGGSDPVLSAEGMERAEKLAGILSELDIDRVYSTNYNRTMDTAQPTADNQGLEITNYGGFDQQAVTNDILENVNGGKVLIVGHSNTTPNFLNVLTGTSDYPNLPENAYDNLFIVNVKSKGDSEVITLKY